MVSNLFTDSLVVTLSIVYRLVLYITFFLVPQRIWGQSGAITGTVILNDCKQPAQQALVEIKGKGMTVTDSNGHYFIKSLPAGKYIVTISFTGYETSSTKWVFVTEGKETRLHVQLRNAEDYSKQNVIIHDPEKIGVINCYINFSK